MNRIIPVWILSALTVWPASATVVPAGDVAAVDAAPAPLLETEAGRAALDGAAALKKAAYKLSGDEREAGLFEAARRYGDVAEQQAFGQRERVEAAYRAGEILRARGRVEEAEARFEQADSMATLVQDEALRDFGARALLELAHARRRAGGEEASVLMYGSLHDRYPEQLRVRVQAASWVGKLHLRAGRLDEAQAVLMDVGPYLPGHAREALRNVELLVDALLEAQRMEDAQLAVARLAGELQAADPDGEGMTPEVSSALEALRGKVAQSGY